MYNVPLFHFARSLLLSCDQHMAAECSPPGSPELWGQWVQAESVKRCVDSSSFISKGNPDLSVDDTQRHLRALFADCFPRLRHARSSPFRPAAPEARLALRRISVRRQNARGSMVDRRLGQSGRVGARRTGVPRCHCRSSVSEIGGGAAAETCCR